MTSTLSGIGSIAFSNDVLPVMQNPYTNAKRKEGKKLIATTDYWSNIIGSKFLFERIHFDSLHKYLASIGVTCHQWMYNPSTVFNDPDLAGYDIIAEVVRSAHAHGLEIYAGIKPFEGGASGTSYPHSLPMPEGTGVSRDIRGIFPIARPFVVANPNLSLKRRPGTYEVKGKVSAIRLVKSDNNPTRIKPEHLTVWISRQNNGFSKYEGPVTFRESSEWRPVFPKSRQCRIIHIENLQIPDDYKYILIRCSLADTHGDFTNERGSIIEIISDHGNHIPFILSTGPVTYEKHRSAHDEGLYEDVFHYFHSPEVQAEFKDPVRAQEHYRDFYSFNENIKITAPYTFDREGYITVALGKPEYMSGNLHPIYPEVRAHWFDMIRFCLDRGVDGINIRTSNHIQSPEEWEYGFNEPVLKAAGRKTDYLTIRHINGNAYTQFLREARDLVKSYGKNFMVHLYSQMIMPDDRSNHLNYIPPNFEWQWETWVKEIADELEFRGAWTLRPWNLRQVLETFSAVTKAANKPFYFQGNMKELGFQDPNKYPFTRQELEMVKNNPEWNGFVLFETQNFTRMYKDGRIEGSPALEELLKEYM